MPAETEPLVEAAYSRLAACADHDGRTRAAAALILAIYDDFYRQLCEYPHRAQRAFETMDPHASIRISQERLGLYSRYIAEHGPRMLAAFPALAADPAVWDALDRLFMAMIVVRYDADIVSTASRLPNFSVSFRDVQAAAEKIRVRVEQLMRDALDGPPPVALDVVEAGFFRDRSAFIVGRWLLTDDRIVPYVVALLNSPEGIYADAVLHRVSDIHDLFSSALANFHVTTRLYYQTCVFLFTLMPRRPFGHQYSTIGFNHVGKVAILNEISEQVRRGHRFQRSPGAPGTVALGFTFDECAYHLKVIRDKPTNSYKWGAFPGVAAVSDKYRAVHEINRAGSMLDNVMYFNLRLDRSMFDPALLDEICREAAGSVQVDQDGDYLRQLIVQLKIVPLPVFLETADEDATRAVMVSLGHCIRN